MNVRKRFFGKGVVADMAVGGIDALNVGFARLAAKPADETDFNPHVVRMFADEFKVGERIEALPAAHSTNAFESDYGYRMRLPYGDIGMVAAAFTEAANYYRDLTMEAPLRSAKALENDARRRHASHAAGALMSHAVQG